MRLSIGCLLVTPLMVAACGSGSKNPEADVTTTAPHDPAAVEVVATSLQETGEADPSGLRFTSNEAECVAAIIVDTLEPSRLEALGLDAKAGVGPELSEPPLTSDEADTVYRAYDNCLNLLAQVTDLLASGGAMHEDLAACVADAYVDSGIMREALLNPQFNEEVNSRVDAVLQQAEARCSG